MTLAPSSCFTAMVLHQYTGFTSVEPLTRRIRAKRKGTSSFRKKSIWKVLARMRSKA